MQSHIFTAGMDSIETLSATLARLQAGTPKAPVLLVLSFSLKSNPGWFGWHVRREIEAPTPLEDVDDVRVSLWTGDPMDTTSAGYVATGKLQLETQSEVTEPNRAGSGFRGTAWRPRTSWLRRCWRPFRAAFSRACRFVMRRGSRIPARLSPGSGKDLADHGRMMRVVTRTLSCGGQLRHVSPESSARSAEGPTARGLYGDELSRPEDWVLVCSRRHQDCDRCPWFQSSRPTCAACQFGDPHELVPVGSYPKLDPNLVQRHGDIPDVHDLDAQARRPIAGNEELGNDLQSNPITVESSPSVHHSKDHPGDGQTESHAFRNSTHGMTAV